MKSGIRRKVDDLGRVVIPAGIRRSLEIREGDALEVSVRGDEVILSKPVDQCVFCYSDQGLHTFRDKALCASCVVAVAVLDRVEEAAAVEHDETRDMSLPDRPRPTPAGRRAGPAHEGDLRVVRSEVATPANHHELPASTTAW